MNIEYTNINGYLIPNLTLPAQPEREIGKYGRMHFQFLAEQEPLFLDCLSVTGTLSDHLADKEQEVREQIELIMQQLLRQDPPPDRQTDPLGWTRHLNSLYAQAEELVMPLLYSV